MQTRFMEKFMNATPLTTNGWGKEGCRVLAWYIGQFEVEGLVTESRVAYGGKVKHTVLLDEPIEVFGAVRDTVVIDDDAISVEYSAECVAASKGM